MSLCFTFSFPLLLYNIVREPLRVPTGGQSVNLMCINFSKIVSHIRGFCSSLRPRSTADLFPYLLSTLSPSSRRIDIWLQCHFQKRNISRATLYAETAHARGARRTVVRPGAHFEDVVREIPNARPKKTAQGYAVQLQTIAKPRWIINGAVQTLQRIFTSLKSRRVISAAQMILWGFIQSAEIMRPAQKQKTRTTSVWK